MAIVVLDPGDPTMLNAQQRERNRTLEWDTFIDDDGLYNVWNPPSGLIAATGTILPEAGQILSNMKLMGHVQILPTP